ncbi:MAG: glycosyltransferase family 4 protein [Ruminococcaceae bacterium]|nr:glycosyltransferase family 4 protein [Oscillospiraceae bacterium]
MYKVCFVTTVSITLKSFVLDFAKALYETGDFEIHFICSDDPEFADALPDYIHFKPIPMKRRISADGLKAIRKMTAYFKKERFDLVQYSTPNASCYASVAAKKAGIPCRLYCQWGIAYVGFRGIARWVFKQFEKMICRLSTKIEPDSFGNLHFAHKEGLYTADKSGVIGFGSARGVDLSKFDIAQKPLWRHTIRQQYGIPKEATVFVFVGRITRDKGINELLEASETLLHRHKDIYLLLVGNTEKTQLLDADLYQRSQTEERIVYTDYTDNVEQYLAASDVYVLPSYREGFGSAVIEAQAMGIPVIVSDIPGPTDAVTNGHNGLTIPKADTAALLEAMEQLYGNAEQRSVLGQNGVALVRERFEQRELFGQMIADRYEMIRNKP